MYIFLTFINEVLYPCVSMHEMMELGKYSHL